MGRARSGPARSRRKEGDLRSLNGGRSARLAVVWLTLLAGPLAAAGDGAWEGEVGLLAGEHDNFFFRGDGSAAPASNLLTGYVEVDRRWDLGASDVDLMLAASAVDVTDINDADYQTYSIGGRYKRGRHRFSLEYGEMINRLYSESGDAVFFDEQSLDAQWRVTLGSRWWVRLRYKTSEWDFDAPQNRRDADIDRLSVTARLQALPSLGIRLGWIDEDRAAVGPENNRVGNGIEIAFEGSPAESVTWFLRLRSRERDYEDAPPEESNFGRSDDTDDVNFNLRWLFAEQVGLYLRDSYREGQSTRPDRNYTGNVAEVGLFFKF